MVLFLFSDPTTRASAYPYAPKSSKGEVVCRQHVRPLNLFIDIKGVTVH